MSNESVPSLKKINFKKYLILTFWFVSLNRWMVQPATIIKLLIL